VPARGDADVVVRRATLADADEVGDVFLTAFRTAMPTIRLAHPDDEVRVYLRDVCIAHRETWLAEATADGRPMAVAFMTLGDASIDQLYVRPGWQGRGIGSRLLTLAQERRPAGFELYAFQVNAPACRFYEARGLVEVDRNEGSRNEEGEPDVRYRWTPV
jgi:ribosomal protein S18 acetylase RimI-like enzyme